MSSAQSVDVTLDIPAGIIAIEGTTSPNAQVKVYENSNDLPALSLVSDTSGNFSGELPQDNTGMVTISLQATDTDGKKSELVSRQVAVIAQQTSTLTIVLPPTIDSSPRSPIFQEGIINFSGQTVPNGVVEVTIEPSTILTTTSDAQGNYVVPLLVKSLSSAGIYTYGVKVTNGLETSDYVIAGTFVVSPPITAPFQPPRGIIDRFISKVVPAPEILSPSGNEYTSAGPFVLSGRAEKGALVTLYDDGAEIGTVIATSDGSWQFYFSPYKERHSLYARACQEEKCSENSRTITVRPSQLPACRPGINLETHRLEATAKKPMSLSGTLPRASAGLVYIQWGDDTSERFDVDPSGELNASHTYQEAGTYSGHIITTAGYVCHSTVYFVVEVSDPTQATPVMLTAVVALIVVIIARLVIRRVASSLK